MDDDFGLACNMNSANKVVNNKLCFKMYGCNHYGLVSIKIQKYILVYYVKHG